MIHASPLSAAPTPSKVQQRTALRSAMPLRSTQALLTLLLVHEIDYLLLTSTYYLLLLLTTYY